MEINEQTEQRMIIKFSVKLEKTSREITEKITTVNGIMALKKKMFFFGGLSVLM